MRLVLIISALFISPSLSAFNGHVKLLNGILLPPFIYNIPQVSPSGQQIQTLSGTDIRLSSFLSPSPDTELQFDFSITATSSPFGTNNQIAPPTDKRSDFRFDDFSAWIYPRQPDSAEDRGGWTGKTIFQQNLDRFYLKWSPAFADITLGRQAISFGVARSITTLDSFSPLASNALESEIRHGVDALRMTIPIGALSEIDMGYIAGHKFSWPQSGAFLRGRFQIASSELMPMLHVFRRHVRYGMAATSAIGNTGINAELTLTRYTDKKKFLAMSLGFDHRPFENALLVMEYHFNEAGENAPRDYTANFTKHAYRDASVTFLGKHYLSAALSWMPHPLLQGYVHMITNLNDASTKLTPALIYNADENIIVEVIATVNAAHRSKFLAQPSAQIPITIKSEFGLHPDSVLLRINHYF